MSMSAVALVNTRDMERSDWLNERRHIIGGSDIGKILGLSKYGSAFTVYMDKLGQLPEEDDPSEAAYWGTQLEDIVAREFTVRTGLKVRRRNQIIVHPERSWMGANIDRELVGVDEGLECKTASAYLSKEWDDDALPDNYYAQVQWYMGVSGFKAWWIAVLIGGQKFIYKRVERDEEFINAAIQIASDFWHNHVLKEDPPVVDGSIMATEFLTKMHPTSNEQEIALPSDAEPIIKAYLQAKEDVAEAESRVKLYENQLKAQLGDNEVGLVGEHRVTWKTVTRKAHEVKESTFRQFKVK